MAGCLNQLESEMLGVSRLRTGICVCSSMLHPTDLTPKEAVFFNIQPHRDQLNI